MAMIKSALEIALERTKGYKADENALKANEIRNEGRRTAGRLLDGEEGLDIAKAMREQDAEFSNIFRKAVFEVLSAQIQLPTGFLDEERFARVSAGIAALAASSGTSGTSGAAGHAAKEAEKRAASMMEQISSFLHKYLEEIERVEKAIRSQWAPRLKEKERQMAARMGQDVRLDPMADPEFSAYYKQNVEGMRAKYRDALERAKEELAALCGIPQE